MLKLRKIAITGGVASGKSSVCQFFKELGAYVASADALVHQLLDSHADLGQQLIRTFGLKIVKDGKINRTLLADAAFSDPHALNQLEALLHPEVRRKLEEHYQRAVKEGHHSCFVAEMPLLFETGSEKLFDVTIAVLADPEKAKKRFEQQGFSNAQYDLRTKRQKLPEEKKAKADYTIYNNGSLAELREKVAELHRTIQRRSFQNP
jgi:dephospho-CoA kinase